MLEVVLFAQSSFQQKLGRALLLQKMPPTTCVPRYGQLIHVLGVVTCTHSTSRLWPTFHIQTPLLHLFRGHAKAPHTEWSKEMYH